MNLKKTISEWEKIKIIRSPKRPNLKFYIENIFNDFIEFHGDRKLGDDSFVVGGIASLNGINITVIGITNRTDTKKSFEMPNLKGYRKSLRLMKQAEKFKRPIICIIDIQGTFCVTQLKERYEDQAIFANFLEMLNLRTPIISLITRESYNTDALALPVADKVCMLEYSIVSPETFRRASFNNIEKIKEINESIKITAQDLKQFGIIDSIIKEPLGGVHKNSYQMASEIKKSLLEEINMLKDKNLDDLVEGRYSKFRYMGEIYY